MDVGRPPQRGASWAAASHAILVPDDSPPLNSDRLPAQSPTEEAVDVSQVQLLTNAAVDDVEQAYAELAAPMKKKRRKANPWITFNKKFSFRAKRKSESSQAYLTARTRAAKRAYNKAKKGGKK